MQAPSCLHGGAEADMGELSGEGFEVMDKRAEHDARIEAILGDDEAASFEACVTRFSRHLAACRLGVHPFRGLPS